MRALFKDFGYYILWWVVIFAVLNALSPVTSDQGEFWRAKAVQTAAGAISGAICASLFTIMQNLANKDRKKVISWAVAIAAAIAFQVAVLVSR